MADCWERDHQKSDNENKCSYKVWHKFGDHVAVGDPATGQLNKTQESEYSQHRGQGFGFLPATDSQVGSAQFVPPGSYIVTDVRGKHIALTHHEFSVRYKTTP